MKSEGFAEEFYRLHINSLPITQTSVRRLITKNREKEQRQTPQRYHDESTGFNPYPTAFPYGNGMVLHFYQQQESSTTKTVHKVINKGLKTYV